MPRLRLPDRSEPSLSSEAAAMISAPIRGQRTTDAISEHFHLMDSSSLASASSATSNSRGSCAQSSRNALAPSAELPRANSRTCKTHRSSQFEHRRSLLTRDIDSRSQRCHRRL
jgi:hypothetical protein